MGIFKYLRTKFIALQLTLENLPQNPSLSSTNELHAHRRMKDPQEATNKSGHPIGEYIVTGDELNKTNWSKIRKCSIC